MNAVDQMLREEMGRLLERVAGGVTLTGSSESSRPTRTPAKLEETEERLAALRRSMLESYGAWDGRWTTSRTSGPWSDVAASSRRSPREGRARGPAPSPLAPAQEAAKPSFALGWVRGISAANAFRATSKRVQ
jgi:hypothetical protein